MDFKLKNDLVFFDVETTGLNVLKDRIIQIALIKYKKNVPEPEELQMLINPGIPISEESMRVHGITPADVANKPTFIQVAKQLYNFIGDSDLAGYNSNRFDLPMLMEEFNRAGYDFNIDQRLLIDVQRIFYKMEPRTLRAAYKFYCDQELTNAHDALADVRATVKVLKGQIHKYQDQNFEDENGRIIEKPVQNDMEKIHQFTNDLTQIDITQRLKYNDKGEMVFNFGKYMNQKVVDVIKMEKQYYHWIMEKDFSVQVKNALRKLVKEHDLKV